LVAGGTVGTGALHVHPLPGLERWSPVGLLPLLGAAAGWWCLARRNRSGMVAGLTAASVLFTGLLAGWGGSALEDYKAPRALVGRFWSEQEGRDVRVGCY